MKRAILLLALIPTPALAGPDTDYPHRDWGKTAYLDMSLTDATACIARELGRKGDALVIPADGGNDIDFAVRPIWGPKMEPWLTFKIREDGGLTTLRVFYRHPVRASGVEKDVQRLQKRCLKVARIEDSVNK